MQKAPQSRTGRDTRTGTGSLTMTRAQLIERILFAVDGYRFGEWSIAAAASRITAVIEQNPSCV
jgi:hypothetical protein